MYCTVSYCIFLYIIYIVNKQLAIFCCESLSSWFNFRSNKCLEGQKLGLMKRLYLIKESLQINTNIILYCTLKHSCLCSSNPVGIVFQKTGIYSNVLHFFIRVQLELSLYLERCFVWRLRRTICTIAFIYVAYYCEPSTYFWGMT